MTTTTAPVLDAEAVSEILCSYLIRIDDDTSMDVSEVDDPCHRSSLAATELLTPQLEAAGTVICKNGSGKGGLEISVADVFALGVEFGVASAVSTLREPPDQAVTTIRELIRKLKITFQRGISGEWGWRRPVDLAEAEAV